MALSTYFIRWWPFFLGMASILLCVSYVSWFWNQVVLCWTAWFVGNLTLLASLRLTVGKVLKNDSENPQSNFRKDKRSEFALMNYLNVDEVSHRIGQRY